MGVLLVTLTFAGSMTPLLEEFAVYDFFGFCDLCKILDFSINAVTGGHGFAHLINIE